MKDQEEIEASQVVSWLHIPVIGLFTRRMGSILGQFLLDLWGPSGNAKLSLSASLNQYSIFTFIIFIFMFIFISIFKAPLKKRQREEFGNLSKKVMLFRKWEACR
jgi:uncharacterized protein YacL